MARYASPPLPHQQSDFDVHMAQAATFLAQGHVAPAIGMYRTAAANAEQRGEYRNALRAYAEIVRLEGPHSDTQIKMGEMQYRSGRPREATATLDRAANIALQYGRVEVGLYAYRLAALAEPTPARWRQVIDWYISLGKQHEMLGSLEEACSELFRDEAWTGFVFVAEQVLQQRPADVAILRMLVRAHLQRKDLHKAAMTIQILLSHRPGDPDALERMAETFAALGRKDKAAEVVARLLDMLMLQPDAKDECKRLVEQGLDWSPHNGRLLAVQRSLAPPPPPRPAPVEQRRAEEDIPDLDLSDFVEVVPSDLVEEVEEIEEIEEHELNELGNLDEFGDFDEPDYTMMREIDYTMVRERDAFEVGELTMVTKEFSVEQLVSELSS